jgi:uncharacterized protein (TIGR02145 family)
MKTTLFKTAYWYCILLLLLPLLAVWSCEKEEKTDANAIALRAPADGAQFDLASVSEVVFEWTDVERIAVYRLLIGSSSDLSDAVSIPLLSSPQIFPAAKLDAALVDLGVDEGQQAALYWSVRPAIADATVTTQQRAITLKRSVRPAIELTAPGETVDGRQTATFPAEFAWQQAPGVADYVIKFSIDDAFPDVSTWQKTFVKDDEVSSLAVETPDDWDAILDKAGVELNGQATVYWTVEPATPDKSVVSIVKSFTGIRPVYPTIYLTTPADNAELNANFISFPLAFSWRKGTADIPGGYTLQCSTDPEFPAAATKRFSKVSNLSHAFSENEYDGLLRDLGVALYEQKPVYWTVTPTTPPTGKTVTFTHSFTAARKTVLTSPAGGSSVLLALDNKQPSASEKVRFEWSAAGAGASYTLVVSTDAEGSNAILTKSGISGTTAEYTHAQLQALIDDASKNLKRYKGNQLYWNIKDNSGAAISENSCPFKLYGTRILIDDRAKYFKEVSHASDFAEHPEWPGFSEPVQDYEVAVLEYNGKEVVWLAEDVRATVPWSNPEEQWTEGPNSSLQPAMPAVTVNGLPVPENYRNRTVPRAGHYYNTGSRTSVPPRGWKIPSADEWDEMLNAAKNAYGGEFGDNVVRHPDFITGANKERANEWGMNFAPLGYYEWCSTGRGDSFYWNDYAIYYQYGDSDKSINWDGVTLGVISCSNGALYRGIYDE